MPAAKTDLLWLPAAVWVPALTATGLTGVHFHDLRHAGNHMVAAAGTNLRELMERMGHSSSRAALICLHSTNERQRTPASVRPATASRTGRRIMIVWERTRRPLTWALAGRPGRESNARPTA